MILERLRTETSTLHTSLDQHPLMTELMRASVSIDSYKQILAKFLGFYRTLEPTLAAHIPINSKLPWLLADLRTLDVDPESVADAPKPTWIHDEASAMGTFYVMEGSTLGGQVLTRNLAKHLALSPGNGLAYFNSYGPDVGRHWKETRERLLAFSAQTAQDDAMIEGARQTFRALALWLDA